MALVFTDLGERRVLDSVAGNVLSGLSLRLFSNDYTPTASSVPSDFVQASFGGYSQQTLGAFDPAVTDGNGDAVVEHSTELEYIATSAETIYGYFVVETGSPDAVIYAERFASAKQIDDGTTFRFTPRMTAGTASA